MCDTRDCALGEDEQYCVKKLPWMDLQWQVSPGAKGPGRGRAGSWLSPLGPLHSIWCLPSHSFLPDCKSLKSRIMSYLLDPDTSRVANTQCILMNKCGPEGTGSCNLSLPHPCCTWMLKKFPFFSGHLLFQRDYKETIRPLASY